MMTSVPVPLVFTVEAMVEHFAIHGEPTGVELFEATGRLGRNHGPALLADLEAEGLLTADAAAVNVGAVWNGAEYPDRCLHRGTWRALFSLAGYTVNGTPAARPDVALTLYRGSVPERRADWSWTDRLDVATGYALGTRASRPIGTVWQATVEPRRLLARNDGPDYRNESEYVVDTDGLDIAEAPVTSP